MQCRRLAELEARQLKASTIEPTHLLLGLCKSVDLDLPVLVQKDPPDRDEVLEEFLREVWCRGKPRGSVRGEQLPQDVGQDAAVADVIDLDGGVDAAADGLLRLRPVGAVDDEGHVAHRLEVVAES